MRQSKELFDAMKQLIEFTEGFHNSLSDLDKVEITGGDKLFLNDQKVVTFTFKHSKAARFMFITAQSHLAYLKTMEKYEAGEAEKTAHAESIYNKIRNVLKKKG